MLFQININLNISWIFNANFASNYDLFNIIFLNIICFFLINWWSLLIWSFFMLRLISHCTYKSNCQETCITLIYSIIGNAIVIGTIWIFKYVRVYLEKVFSKCPFLLTMNICWLDENKCIVRVHFCVVWMKVSLWISANKWTFHIKMLIIVKVKHAKSTHWIFIYSLIVYFLVIKCWNLNNIWPISYFLNFLWVFRRGYSSSNSNSVISSWIQICNNTSMSFSLINLSELLDPIYLHSNSIL